MSIDVIANNLLAAPVLFFFVGFVAMVLKSDLELPPALSKLVSLYLIMAIGLKGGIELNHGGLTVESLRLLGAAVVLSAAVPFGCYVVLRARLDPHNAAAVAATYGSVSAVTFITGVAVLDLMKIEYHGYMVAALALMEAPAIIIGVALARRFGDAPSAHRRENWGALFRETLLHGPIFLLLSSLVVGRLMSPSSATKVLPFFEHCFPGVLCLYLFEMGVNASKRLLTLNVFDWWLTGFAIVTPLVNAGVGIGASWFLGASPGDALLLTLLMASASYVAVPAAMNMAVPKADPGVYVTMALGITFPFNIAIGIPLYLALIRLALG